jgi:hypothetical protein
LTALRVIEVIAGAVLVASVMYDLFKSVILPRPAVGLLRLTQPLVGLAWQWWRAGCTRVRTVSRREALLSAFGPLTVPLLLVVWGAGIIVGYALILHGLRDELHPQLQTFGNALYFSSQCLLTIGFGDIVPADSAARVLVILEAATGLGLVALLISLLFSLFNSFQRRETAVIALDALAGAPPSGVQLLETCARDGMPAQLEKTFDEWRRWAAEVLESHLAFPMLNYFRSSHDNEAWLNSFGAVMDAASLVLSAVEDGPRGPARFMFKVGSHLVADLDWYYRHLTDGVPLVEHEEFNDACTRLRDAGYRVDDSDASWERFTKLRGAYASSLNRLSRLLAIAPAPWIGDRSYLPHRDPRRRRRRPPRTAAPRA